MSSKHSFLGLKNLTKNVPILLINILIIVFTYLYIWLRFPFINDQIPFWYTRVWGDGQLAEKINIYWIPTIALFITFVGAGITWVLQKMYVRYAINLLLTITTTAVLILTYSSVRIIFVASSPFEPLINPTYVSLLIPFFISFALVYGLLPIFIEYAEDRGIVTNPVIHKHPGMLLDRPTARGGGIIYAVVFVVLSAIFVGVKSYLLIFLLAVLIVGLIGIIDDIQNTNIHSQFKFFENPIVRLICLFIPVLWVVLSGIRIDVIKSPLGGFLEFASYSINVFGQSVPLLSVMVTAIWVVWVMNMLSWSNGVDGQFGGIVGISSLILVLLALRFTQTEERFWDVALMGAISAGAAFGFLKHTWNPSRIMWGFGATSAGLVISFLAILISAKVTTSIMILLIPFLDSLVTVVRRVLQRQFPLKGDRGHLHHLLLEKGWSIKKIAVFYWFTTLVFGLIGVLTAEKYTFQSVLIAGGVVAFAIVLLNLKSSNHKVPQ